MWNVEVANDADAKRGLAPRHREIDRNPPYKRIATEEVAAYDAFDMSVEHKRMLMQTNAERVFRLSR